MTRISTSCSRRWVAKLCRSVCGDTRFLIPAAWAAARTARLNCRVDSGSTGLKPGNSQPPGSSRLRRRPSRHQTRSSLSSCGDSIAWRSLRPLPRSTRSSMRLESISPTLSTTTSETRSPAPHGSGLRPARGQAPAVANAALYFGAVVDEHHRSVGLLDVHIYFSSSCGDMLGVVDDLGSLSVSVVACRRAYLSPENAVADDGVEQHQREDEQALAPKHEGEAGVRRRGFLDRDRERDHVGPERDRQRAKRRRKDEGDHVVRNTIAAAPNAFGRYERRDHADRGENKQIRPLEPSVHDLKVFRQGVGEDDDQESEQSNCQIGDQAIGFLPHIAFAFSDEPTRAEEGVTETQTDTAQNCEEAEPTELATGIMAVRDRKPLN